MKVICIKKPSDIWFDYVTIGKEYDVIRPCTIDSKGLIAAYVIIDDEGLEYPYITECFDIVKVVGNTSPSWVHQVTDTTTNYTMNEGMNSTIKTTRIKR